MCLIAFAWCAHPRYRLVLAGNRDEFHERPTEPLAPWLSEPSRLLAGRDLECGGTWLGVAEPDRACVVTNVRDPHASQDRRSRGLLVLDYLRGAAPAREHAAQLVTAAADYRPFNLLLFDRDTACYVTNHPQPAWKPMFPGVFALSNGSLDDSWPKARRLCAALTEWIEERDAGADALFAPLADETRAPEAELPDTGVGIERERLLSPAFIRGECYGTRASTLVTITHGGAGEIIERRFGPNGVAQGESAFRFSALPTRRQDPRVARAAAAGVV